MTSGSCACWSARVNTLVNPVGELDELAGTQGPAKGSNAGSNEALIPSKAPTLPLILLNSKDLFTKFMKVFMETTQTQTQALTEPQDRPLKATPRKPIPENLIWIATTFVSNVKIISRPQAPQRWIIPLLPPPSSVALSASDKLNTSDATNALLPSHGQSSRLSSGIILGAPRPSLTVFGASLGGTPSTSWKKPETGHPTFNTSNLSYQSSTGPPMN